MLTAAISVCPAERVGDERVDAVAAAAAAPAEVPSPVGDAANNEVALHDRQDVRRGATRRRGVAAAAGRVTAAGSRRRRGAGRRRGGLAVAGPAAGAAPRRLRLRQMSQSDAGRRCRRYCVGGVRQHRTAVLLIASCSHLPPYTPPPRKPLSSAGGGYKFPVSSKSVKWFRSGRVEVCPLHLAYTTASTALYRYKSRSISRGERFLSRERRHVLERRGTA